MTWDARYNAQDTISALLPRIDKCIRGKVKTVTISRDECRAIMHVIDLLAAKPQEPEKLA